VETKPYEVSVQSGGTLEERVSQCLRDLGGIENLVPPGGTVLIKPNLVVEEDHRSGATTNPAVVEALIRELQRVSPREIIIGEGSATFCST